MKTCVLYLLHGEDLVPIWKNSLMTLRKSGYRQKVITYTTIKITPKLRKFARKFRCRMEPLVIEGFEKDHEYHEINSQEFNRISYEKFAIMHRALKQKFELTLVDLSPEMLQVSQKLNPNCKHLQGDTAQLLH